MNERIKRLFNKAGVYAYEQNPGENSYGRPVDENKYEEDRYTKFAELIVRECLDIIETNNPCPPGTTIIYSFAQGEYFDKGWQVAVETKSNQIQKYFGVEK